MLEHALAPLVELETAPIRTAIVFPGDARRALSAAQKRAAEILAMLVEHFVQLRVALGRAELHPGAPGVGDRIVDSRHLMTEVLEHGDSFHYFAHHVALHELAEVGMKRDAKFFRDAREDRIVG